MEPEFTFAVEDVQWTQDGPTAGFIRTCCRCNQNTACVSQYAKFKRGSDNTEWMGPICLTCFKLALADPPAFAQGFGEPPAPQGPGGIGDGLTEEQLRAITAPPHVEPDMFHGVCWACSMIHMGRPYGPSCAALKPPPNQEILCRGCGTAHKAPFCPRG